MRSLGYDLRRSKRFRRIGTMAVATMAGGVIAAGTLLQGDQVPGISALGGDGEDSDIIEGWFGLGAETAEQEAETSGTASEAPEAADSTAPGASSEPESRTRGGGSGSSPAGSPGLVPIGGDDPSDPTEEGSHTVSPTPTNEPTDEPTTDEPTTDAPTTDAPTTDEPSPTEETTATPEQAPRGSVAPLPRKGLIGG
jgi:hypothetical protein